MANLPLRTHWRSLWRNRRRTLITLAAVAFNVALLVLMIGWMEGVYALMITNSTRMTVGEAQVHAPGYLENRQLHKVVDHHQAIIDTAREQGIGAAPRLFGFGLVAAGQKSNGAMLWGVDPAAEKANFLLPEKVREGGRFLADEPVDRSTGALPEIVLGSKLAETLHAKVGDEVVAFIQAADGSGFDTLFRLVGVLRPVGSAVDTNGAFIHRTEFRRIFFPPNPTAWYAKPDGQPVIVDDDGNGSSGTGNGDGAASQGDGFDLFEDFDPAAPPAEAPPPIDPASWTPPDLAHEIALSTAGRMDPHDVAAAVRPVAGERNDVQTWLELNPAIASVLATSKSTQWIMYAIFYLIAGLSVLNTMLMATWERMREFGVMKAIGTSPLRLVSDVAIEAALLGAVASVLGAILGAAVTATLSQTGIDFRGILDEGASFSGIALDPVWYPLFRPASVILPMIGMTIICWLASLYPALLAARVDPAKILHEQ